MKATGLASQMQSPATSLSDWTHIQLDKRGVVNVDHRKFGRILLSRDVLLLVEGPAGGALQSL